MQHLLSVTVVFFPRNALVQKGANAASQHDCAIKTQDGNHQRKVNWMEIINPNQKNVKRKRKNQVMIKNLKVSFLYLTSHGYQIQVNKFA